MYFFARKSKTIFIKSYVGSQAKTTLLFLLLKNVHIVKNRNMHIVKIVSEIVQIAKNERENMHNVKVVFENVQIVKN